MTIRAGTGLAGPCGELVSIDESGGEYSRRRPAAGLRVNSALPESDGPRLDRRPVSANDEPENDQHHANQRDQAGVLRLTSEDLHRH
jgi:hypothetical protein